MRRASVLIGALTCWLAACGSPDSSSESAFGLRRYEIRISDENRIQLLHGGRQKNPVPATLIWGNIAFPGTLSLSGNSSLFSVKKSYKFEGAEDAAGLPFASMKLSAQVQDPSFLRTLLGTRILQAAGVPVPRIEPVALYFNQDFQGLFLLIERPDSAFYRRNGFEVERIYKALPLKADFRLRTVSDPECCFEGKLGAFPLMELSGIAHWASADSPEGGLGWLESRMDVGNLIAHLAGILFVGNCDGIDNNYYLFKTRGDPKLRFSPWDWERSWKDACPVSHFFTRNRVFGRLVGYPEKRRQLHHELTELLSKFPPEEMRRILRADGDWIRKAYVNDWYLDAMDLDLDEQLDELFRSHLRWRRELEAWLNSTPPTQSRRPLSEAFNLLLEP